MALVEVIIAREAAYLEATHGEPEEALLLFDATIDALHRAGNLAHLRPTFITLAALFDRIDQPGVAATLVGSTISHTTVNHSVDVGRLADKLRNRLGTVAFDECIAVGARMSLPEAAQYARQRIRTTRHERSQGT